ncbi:MAG: TRAP transporter substrate-binding protein DctP [Desulfatibacillaceae bacterium]
MPGKRHGLVMLLAAAMLAACLWSGPARAADYDMYRWKLATLAPKSLGWAQQVRTIILPWIEQSTDDNLRLKFYWGGIMGNDEDYIKKIHIGQIHGAGLTGHGSNLACPEFSVVGLPFLFNNWEEVDYIKKVMFPTFDYYFEQHGYKLLLWIDQDFDQVYSSRWRFDNLDDFRRSKFQSWYGPQETAMLEALGATPIPIPPTEAATAYRTGVVDSNIGPAIYQVGSQMYTVCKYVNTMKTRYAPASILIDVDTYYELPESYRRRLEERRVATQDLFCDAVRKDNARCVDGMVQYGLEMVEIPEDNEKEIVSRAMTVYEDLSGDLYSKGLLVELRRYLADYRAGRRVDAPAPVTEMVKAGEVPKVATPGRMIEQKETVVAVVPQEEVTPAPRREPPKPVVEAPRQPEPAPPKMERPAPTSRKVAEPEEEEGHATLDDLEKESSTITEKERQQRLAKAEQRKKQVRSAWQERARLIWEVQTRLRPMGYYKGQIDGLFGPLTFRAIQEYQRDQGLRITGAIDNELLDSLDVE